MYQIYCASVFWLKQKSLGVLGQNFNTVLVSVQPIIIANSTWNSYPISFQNTCNIPQVREARETNIC